MRKIYRNYTHKVYVYELPIQINFIKNYPYICIHIHTIVYLRKVVTYVCAFNLDG